MRNLTVPHQRNSQWTPNYELDLLKEENIFSYFLLFRAALSFLHNLSEFNLGNLGNQQAGKHK